MANRAIHQQPFASNRVAGDVFMIDRSTNTLKLDESTLPPTLLTAQVVIAAADVLTMFTTPVQVIPAADAGTAYLIRGGVIEFANGTTNYATNVTASRVGTSTPTNAGYGALINDRTLVPLFYELTGCAIVQGDGVSIKVLTGNPTAGDSDITVTVYYYVITL